MNRGHVLLVGVGGSGKKCITKLAAYAAECSIFEIKLCRGYNENIFKEDLKILYNSIGVENKKTVFLFSSAQIVEEGFLEIINNILTVGSVPALFTDDEKDAIVGSCRDSAKEHGYQVSKYFFFWFSVFIGFLIVFFCHLNLGTVSGNSF